jgi:hypothetical protein
MGQKIMCHMLRMGGGGGRRGQDREPSAIGCWFFSPYCTGFYQRTSFCREAGDSTLSRNVT